jgi:hypothetical protein
MAAGLALALKAFSVSDRRLATILDSSIASMSKPLARVLQAALTSRLRDPNALSAELMTDLWLS